MVKQFNIQELISKPFDRADYIRFLKTLFEIKPENQSLEVTEQYSEYISSGEYLGDYELDREKIHLYIINLKGKSVERARVFQRNFIARDLRNHGGENALVVFYNDNQWRISFVKREKVEGKEQQLSAKRFSFFVGKNEINNTCIQRIKLLLKKDKPSIKDVEEAFSVEKVKDEFFKEYKLLFDDLYKEIKKLRLSDNLINEEFTEKNISEEDFAKKILGQIVFLYFLQKKGWLGIERNPITKKFGEFGEGNQNFLQKLFDIAKKRKKNFFNDYLENLFYKALADSSRKADNYEFEIDGNEWKIPFLNGGLFEPIGEYDWKRTDIKIDNKVFKKVLETFNKYNFTVREDEPMEKEVAIDPEMLGKVFENLLETKERKSTGSFYTPREIVHYMCQQSLINYLETNTEINKKILEKFVTEDCSLELPAEIEANSEKIDRLLKEIKIVDPAVGSGAFLVGMMTEIVKARSYLNKDKRIFDLKEECIEDNLYGVDISPGAVDICQLRLWLSLVVDEENYGNVKPLPNLDYKIMCGNSLIEDYKGMKLWNDEWIGIKKIGPDKQEEIKKIDIKIRECKAKMPYLINKRNEKKNIEKQIKKLEKEKKELIKSNGRNLELFMSESQRKLEMLKSLHKKFININDRAEKQEYKKKIETATIDLIKSKLIEEKNEEALKEIEDILQKKRAQPFFLWKMNFIDVFQREDGNQGFDVVIGNPPYVRQEEFKEIKGELKKEFKDFFNGRADLYTYFYKKGDNLLRLNGILAYISSNKFFVRGYGFETRKLLGGEMTLSKIINFGELPVFKAAVDSAILIAQKSDKKCLGPILTIQIKKANEIEDLDSTIKRDAIPIEQSNLKSGEWVLNDPKKIKLLEKIRFKKISLNEYCENKIFAGIKTGYDGAFVINGKTKDELVKQDKKSLDLIKPWFKGKDIRRWKADFKDTYIIYIPLNKIDIKNYPAIERHLLNYKEKLSKRATNQKWFEIQQPQERFTNLFHASKVIYPDCAKEMRACYDNTGAYGTMAMYFIPYDPLIMCILNSPLFDWYARMTFATFGDPWKGGRIIFKSMYMRQVPIPKISPSEQKPFIEKVDKILDITKDEDYLTNDSKKEKVQEIENEIDKMVYKLYDLTPEEIKIVEGFGNEK